MKSSLIAPQTGSRPVGWKAILTRTLSGSTSLSQSGIDLDKLNQLVDELEAETYAAGHRSRSRLRHKAAGGRTMAAGKATSIEGDLPKQRVVVIQWDSMEKIQAWRNSAAFKELLPERDKLAKFRAFVVDGQQ